MSKKAYICLTFFERQSMKLRVGNSIIGFWHKSIVFVIERLKDRFDREKDQIASVDLF